MTPNLILATDSYKLSHAAAYPTGINGMFAYIEARSKGDTIVPFGLQMWLEKLMVNPVEYSDITAASVFAAAHGEPFDPRPWEKMVRNHRGRPPVVIRAVPEGTRVPSGNAIVTIECTDPDLFWLPMYLETSLQRGVWYPTTIASTGYESWRVLRRYAAESCDDLSVVPFQLHDFGGRGVTCAEQAEIGGAAHTVYSMGSDTIEGIRAANHHYSHPMAAFSVPATEHSVQCAFGPMNQQEYLEHVLDTYAKPGKIVSIVIDGYDTFREAELLCSMKDAIVASGARVVFRPDSGDPLQVVPRLLRMQEVAFGAVRNSKGFKVINNVGVLQGDGIDLLTMELILAQVTRCGYASQNVVFGSGGARLQKVNRDTYSFAQKASAVRIGHSWQGIWKDPITDPGKKSKMGRLTLLRSKMTGEYMTSVAQNFDPSEWEDAMQVVYDGERMQNRTTLDEVRGRAQA